MAAKYKIYLNFYMLLIFGLIYPFSITGCVKEAKEKSRQAQPEIIPVKATGVKLKVIQNVLDYVGDIKAENEAIVYPRVGGKIIEKLKNEGDPVVKGEGIAYIDRDEVGFKFEHAPVESTLDGMVGRIFIDIGQNVTAQSPIALIVNTQKVRINLDVPEKYLSSIALKQQAVIAVDAYPGKEFLGFVTKISPVVDLATRTVFVEITVDNPERLLKTGMFADVSLIIQERKNAPVILKEAVMGYDPDTYVYVVEHNKAFLKKIKLGMRQGPYYEVKEGLEEGDLVVVVGQERLYEGAGVVVEEQ